MKWEFNRTKRTDLIKLLERNGWRFVRNGGNHDIYSNGTRIETIERHKEIPEQLAKAIIKRNNLKRGVFNENLLSDYSDQDG